MRFKMENKNKIANIVEGNKDLLSELYLPILIDMEAEDRVKSLKNGNFLFDREWAQELFSRVPAKLKARTDNLPWKMKDDVK